MIVYMSMLPQQRVIRGLFGATVVIESVVLGALFNSSFCSSVEPEVEYKLFLFKENSSDSVFKFDRNL